MKKRKANTKHLSLQIHVLQSRDCCQNSIDLYKPYIPSQVPTANVSIAQVRFGSQWN